MDKLLSLILDYKMNKVEAKAWKIAILYMQLAEEHFPDHKRYQIGKGDPRKKSIFKYCYKLIRECDSLLEDFEYRMYIVAQFAVLKNIKTDDLHAHIDPNVLVGPKAWKRWLVWKKRFQNETIQNHAVAEEKPSENKVYGDLREAKKVLESKFSELTKQKIIDSLKNRSLFRWVALSQITPYYLVLSPIVQEWVTETGANLLESFAIDLSYYRSSVTKDVEKFFQDEFAYEYIIS